MQRDVCSSISQVRVLLGFFGRLRVQELKDADRLGQDFANACGSRSWACEVWRTLCSSWWTCKFLRVPGIKFKLKSNSLIVGASGSRSTGGREEVRGTSEVHGPAEKGSNKGAQQLQKTVVHAECQPTCPTHT